MKKSILNFRNVLNVFLMLIASLSMTQDASAQSDAIRAMHSANNNIKLSVETPGKFQLAYERAIVPFHSLSIGITGYSISRRKYSGHSSFLFPGKTVAKQTKKGILLNAEYRYYIISHGKSLNGLYLAPHVFWGMHDIEYTEIHDESVLLASSLEYDKTIASESVTTKGYGIKLGYQKRWDRFNIDMGVNLSKSSVIQDIEGLRIDKNNVRAFDKEIEGTSTRFYFGVGLAF